MSYGTTKDTGVQKCTIWAQLVPCLGKCEFKTEDEIKQMITNIIVIKQGFFTYINKRANECNFRCVKLRGNMTYFFSLFPAPVSLKPLANGL